MRPFYQKYSFLLLIIIPLLFFYPIFQGFVLFPGATIMQDFYPWKDLGTNIFSFPGTHRFYGGDPFIAFYPWKLIGINMIKNGIWPLWNFYSFAGSPLLSNSQSAIFYPLNALYFFMDFSFAWSLSNILQTILAGIFTYLFLREYKLSQFSSLWGSFIYAWNGFFANYFHIQVIGNTLIWLPLILYSIKKMDEKKNWKFKGTLIIVFSLTAMFLAGFLQMAFYSLIIIYAFSFFYHRKSLSSLILATCFSIGLSAFQLFSTFEYLRNSERQMESFYTLSTFLLSPIHFIKLIMPHFFGHPNSNDWWGKLISYENIDNSYIGIPGLIFAFIGIYFTLKRKCQRIWIIIIGFFLFFSVDSPWTRFFYGLPLPLINAVTPARAQGMILLPMAFLSALGFEKCISKEKKFQLLVVKITVVIIIIAIVSYLFTLKLYSREISNITWQSLIYCLFISFSLLFVLILSLHKRISFFLILITIFTIQNIDLLRENKFYTRIFTPTQFIYPQTPLTDFLLKDQQNRFLSLDLYTLIPNTFMPYGLSTLTAYDAIHLKNSSIFMETIFQNASQKYSFDARCACFSNLPEGLTRMLNIRYILSSTLLNKTNYKFIEKIGSVYVYENKKVLPKAFPVSEWTIINNKNNKENKQLFKSEYNPEEKVFLEEIPLAKITDKKDYFNGMLNNNLPSLKWKINVNEQKLLFISESFDNGWHAFVDGKETKIYQANISFQAIMLPPGQHTVELIYNPQSFQVGLLITLISLILIIFWASLKVFFNKKDNSNF